MIEDFDSDDFYDMEEEIKELRTQYARSRDWMKEVVEQLYYGADIDNLENAIEELCFDFDIPFPARNMIFVPAEDVEESFP